MLTVDGAELQAQQVCVVPFQHGGLQVTLGHSPDVFCPAINLLFLKKK